MKTREEAEKRAMELFPDNQYKNAIQVRKSYMQCFEDMQSDLVSFGNFLLADRCEGNYLLSKKHVTHADLENWKNDKK